jgi:hypothetical protein
MDHDHLSVHPLSLFMLAGQTQKKLLTSHFDNYGAPPPTKKTEARVGKNKKTPLLQHEENHPGEKPRLKLLLEYGRTNLQETHTSTVPTK